MIVYLPRTVAARRTRPCSLAVVLLMACCAVQQAGAQRRGDAAQQAAPVAGGAVTGHVFCADTQRPARFAEVQLIEVPAAAAGGRAGQTRFGMSVGGRTSLDGSFAISGVSAGDYYVVARVPGYIDPPVNSLDDVAAMGFPQVRVEAGRSSSAEVTIRRGATLTGHVQYDDGTPVAGVQVFLRSATASPQTNMRGLSAFGGGGFSGRMGTTDDRGFYRVAGIAPGKYVLSATVMTGNSSLRGDVGRAGPRSMGEPVVVYAPNVMYRADARIVEFRGTEDVTDVDVTVALEGLHKVQGAVLAQDDRHPIGVGMVTLTDTADGGFVRRATLDANGMYEFSYVPAGSYTISAVGSDPRPQGNRPANRSYQEGKGSVAVTEHDMTVEDVLLPLAGSSGTQ